MPAMLPANLQARGRIMALREFEIELDSRHFQVSAEIMVREGAVVSIGLDDVSEWPDDDGPSVKVDERAIPSDLLLDLCADIEKQIDDAGTLRDLEAEDRERARELAIDSQISAWKERC